MNKVCNRVGRFSCLPVLTVASLFFAACGSDDIDSGPNLPAPDPADSVSAPVETREPETGYEPAFAAQTRAPGVVSETAYSVTTFASGLNSPWGMDNLPDGRILLSEKNGSMRIVSQSGEVGNAISGIPAVNSAGQGGLLDVAVDPDFTENRRVYWSFSQDGDNGTATAVGRGMLAEDEASIEDAEVIYTAIPEYNGTAHYGSRLVWDAEGHLFVSTGERSDAGIREEAQSLDAALGKVLRITTEGEPAPGNPFIGQADALPEIYTYGHRNVQGLAVHPATGALWEAELGPRGGDEVNLIQAGRNYGWPVISYGIEYAGGAIGEGITQQSGMEQPVYYWDPVVSPSGITFYSGSLIPEWTHNLFLAGLNGEHLVRLVIEDDQIIGEERLLEEEGRRLRDVMEGQDGALYVITDGNDAVMYRIAP